MNINSTNDKEIALKSYTETFLDILRQESSGFLSLFLTKNVILFIVVNKELKVLVFMILKLKQ
ncbi:hypothetical protein, partial [Mycoplasmopsis bovis]|uniref:hypothetical protein n=1 Tax=Mycoplasmopsis bovis TaxID=28903 RepID=UPI003D2B2E9B